MWEAFDCARSRARPLRRPQSPLCDRRAAERKSARGLGSRRNFRCRAPSRRTSTSAFRAEDGLTIDDASGRAWLARSLREEGFSVGRILAEIDISELLRVRKQVLLTLITVNAGLALGFALVGSLALARMLKPLSVLTGYMERVRAGRADPIPESKRRRISREFDLLFDRFNAMARALNDREELASRLADAREIRRARQAGFGHGP